MAPTATRTDWSLSLPHTPWSSTRVYLEGVVPTSWQSCLAAGVVFLKDTRSDTYCNILLDGGHQFSYELPKTPREQDKPVIDSLRDAAARGCAGGGDAAEGEGEEAQRSSPPKLVVRLFSTENARNHFLGEFVPVRFSETAGRVTLHRLRVQDPHLVELYSFCPRKKKKRRSMSECKHEGVIRDVFRSFQIAHEPEAAVNLDGALVKDGRWSSWSADTYTVDFICCLGVMRVCIESKSSVAEVDQRSLARCLALRDGSMTRVVVLAGHGSEQRWFDMGAPGSSGVPTVYATGAELLEQLKGELSRFLLGVTTSPTTSPPATGQLDAPDKKLLAATKQHRLHCTTK